ncbi:MAG TPA: hypothetical protein VLK33_08720 [Terriglobales bacterium]|nr:hypothetical protein [Terriglobales bacterium]
MSSDIDRKMINILPSDIAQGATLRGNEYGWIISSFPDALARVESQGYASLGGQFQFRLEDGSICEMYWLNAEANDRKTGESWTSYSHRSCSEVLNKFKHLMSVTDFKKEALNWTSVRIDAVSNLVFVAYFVKESYLENNSLPQK